MSLVCDLRCPLLHYTKAVLVFDENVLVSKNVDVILQEDDLVLARSGLS